MQFPAIALLCVMTALAPPQVEWKMEMPGVPSSPTPWPNAARPEAVAVGAGNTVFLVNGDGSVRWRADLEAPVATAITVADIDGDKNVESLAMLTSGVLICLDRDGKPVWRHEFADPAGVFSILCAADLHPARGLELVTGFESGWLCCLDAQGGELWRFMGDRFRVSPVAVGDVDGDGAAEIIYGTDNNHVYCLDGYGNVKWRFSGLGPFGRSGPNLADLDGDGVVEVLLTRSNAGPDRCLLALDGRTGALKWQAPSEMQGYVSNAVADMNGDGRLDVIHADKGNFIYCVDAVGHELWRSAGRARGIFWAPAVADFNGDGSPEMLMPQRGVAPETGECMFLLENGGAAACPLKLGSSGNVSPAAGDFDGDGVVEGVVSVEGPNALYMLSWGGRGPVSWPCMRGNSAMTAATGLKAAMTTGKTRKASTDGISVAPFSVFAGSNTLEAAWDTPAGPDAYAVLSVSGPAVPTVHRVYALKEGASSGRFDYQTQDKRVDIAFNVFLCDEKNLIVLFCVSKKTRPAWDAGLDTLDEALQDAERAGVDAPVLRARSYALHAEADRLQARRREPVAALADAATALRRGMAQLTQLAQALTACHKEGRGGGFVAWPDDNPWDTFDPGAMPEVLPSDPALHVEAFGDEREDAVLNLLNISDDPLNIRCFFAKPDLTGGRAPREPDLARHVTLRRAVCVPSQWTEHVPDALPELDLSRTITLSPGSVEQLWLVIDTHGLPPGEHQLPLYVGSLEKEATILKIPVTITVLPVQLPEGVYAQMNWCGTDVQETSDQQLQDMLDHGINVAYGPALPQVPVDEAGNLAGPVDWSRLDAGLARLPAHFQLLWGGPPQAQWPDGKTPPENDPAQERAYGVVLHAFADHLAAVGFDVSRWAFYPMDEPWLTGTANIPYLRKFCERVKAVMPEVRIYANPAGYVRTEYLDDFKNLIDVWQPEINMLKRDPELLEWFRANARTLWAYEATDPGKDLLPLGYYRALGWLGWKLAQCSPVYVGSSCKAAKASLSEQRYNWRK